jgi:hypothetical protein
MPSFLPFRPDAGELASSEVSNVFMTAGGYGPRPTLDTRHTIPSTHPRGMYACLDPTGSPWLFAANATALYSFDEDLTPAAITGLTSLTVPENDGQAMTRFGAYLLTSNVTDGMYSYEFATTTVAAVSAAPDAHWLFAANNQVVALGDGASNTSRLSVSAFGDHTNWSGKGADQQDILYGGKFTGGGDLGNGRSILLQQNAVRLMTFGDAGGGALFRLDQLSDTVGCSDIQGQIIHNGVCYFATTGGFYACDGGKPIGIGAGKIDRWFLERNPSATIRCVGVDPTNNIVRWCYAAPNDGSVSYISYVNSYIDYNFRTGEFVPGTESLSGLFFTSPPYSGSGGPEALTPVFGGVGSARDIGFFEGTAAAATLETPTETSGASVLVNWCEPMTDGSAATVQVGVKDKLSDSITWKTAVAIKASGRTPVRASGRYQRYRINHAAGATWTNDVGVTGVVASTGGPR